MKITQNKFDLWRWKCCILFRKESKQDWKNVARSKWECPKFIPYPKEMRQRVHLIFKQGARENKPDMAKIKKRSKRVLYRKEKRLNTGPLWAQKWKHEHNKQTRKQNKRIRREAERDRQKLKSRLPKTSRKSSWKENWESVDEQRKWKGHTWRGARWNL